AVSLHRGGRYRPAWCGLGGAAGTPDRIRHVMTLLCLGAGTDLGPGSTTSAGPLDLQGPKPRHLLSRRLAYLPRSADIDNADITYIRYRRKPPCIDRYQPLKWR